MDHRERANPYLPQMMGGKRWSRKSQKPLDLDVKPVNPVRGMSKYKRDKLREFGREGKVKTVSLCLSRFTGFKVVVRERP